MSAVKTFDPAKVIITFGGVPLTGFADGTFIAATPSSERFTKVVGADGEVGRSKSNDNTHEVTMTLMATSQSNDYLSGISATDRLTNLGKLPLTITDLNGTSIFFWKEAWLKQPADYEGSKEISERAWVFDTGQSIADHIGGSLS